MHDMNNINHTVMHFIAHTSMLGIPDPLTKRDACPSISARKNTYHPRLKYGTWQPCAAPKIGLKPAQIRGLRPPILPRLIPTSPAQLAPKTAAKRRKCHNNILHLHVHVHVHCGSIYI
jgi:hypothetical protein